MLAQPGVVLRRGDPDDLGTPYAQQLHRHDPDPDPDAGRGELAPPSIRDRAPSIPPRPFRSLEVGTGTDDDRTSAVPISVNGVEAHVPDDRRVSLLDLLRERLGLYGTKKGCDQGACGACTVLVDGERILSCLALAVQYEGRGVTTVEGLAGDPADDPAEEPALHPLQRAFVDHEGLQCGYCTPGQLCSAIGMVAELRRGVPSHVTADLTTGDLALTGEEVRERMSGNLCRCGAYNGIVAAITATYGGARADR